MADTKSLESYNDPDEFNYIGLTLNVTGDKGRKYDCHAKTFKDTALDVVGTEFSDNVVAEYNNMISARQKEKENGTNKSFSDSVIVKKACYYMCVGGKVNNTNDHINKEASSLYMDVAVAAAMNRRPQGNEQDGAANADFRCQGIARTRSDVNKECVRRDAFGIEHYSGIKPEQTIQYYDGLYAQNNMGSVKVDLENKNDLRKHLEEAEVKPGARVVCDVEEPKHDSAVVYAVKKKGSEGYDFYEFRNDTSIRLDPSKAKDQSMIAKAQEAIENKQLKAWEDGQPTKKELAADPRKSTKVEYDYILKETREYMYTGKDSKTGEPTFSRLTTNGGDLNVPISQLPITQTKAVIDHTKLCLAKAEKELDNSPTLNPAIVKNFVPNVDFDYTLPKDKALGWNDVNNMKMQAKRAFENTYNPNNSEIQGMLLAQNMKEDHERAVNLADDRSKASQEVQETKEIPVLADENQGSFKQDPALAIEDDKNKNDPTKGILAMAQRSKGGRI